MAPSAFFFDASVAAPALAPLTKRYALVAELAPAVAPSCKMFALVAQDGSQWGYEWPRIGTIGDSEGAPGAHLQFSTGRFHPQMSIC